jgi:hypothetical protein
MFVPGCTGLERAKEVNTRPCETLDFISFCEIAASAQRDEGLSLTCMGYKPVGYIEWFFLLSSSVIPNKYSYFT